MKKRLAGPFGLAVLSVATFLTTSWLLRSEGSTSNPSCAEEGLARSALIISGSYSGSWAISTALNYRCGGASGFCTGWGYLDVDINLTSSDPDVYSHSKYVEKSANQYCQPTMPTRWDGNLWIADTVNTLTGQHGTIYLTGWVSSTRLSLLNKSAHEADPSNLMKKPWVLGGNLSFYQDVEDF